MGYSPADLIAPPYELGTTHIYTENASPPYKVTPDLPVENSPQPSWKDIDGGTTSSDEKDHEELAAAETSLLTYDPTTGGENEKEEEKKTINYTE